MYNDPTVKADPLGDEGEDCCKEAWDRAVDFLKSADEELTNTLNNGYNTVVRPLNTLTNTLNGAYNAVTHPIDTYNSFNNGLNNKIATFVNGDASTKAKMLGSLAVSTTFTLAGTGETKLATALEGAQEVKAVEAISDDAVVVRGGLNTPENIKAGTATHPSGVTGVSVECGNCTVKELAKPLPHNKVGVTTVGDVRKAGGDVIRTKGGSPNHATLTGLSPEKTSKLLNPVIPNPNKAKL